MSTYQSSDTVRAGLYQRVSNVKHGDERSIDEQDTANSAVAEAAGWSVVERYSEPNRSASRFATKAREVWAQVVADIQAARMDVLVLWESSRASRTLPPGGSPARSSPRSCPPKKRP